MQVPIKVSSDGGPEEWVLLELQGDLESRTNEQLADNFIGDLHYTKQATKFQRRPSPHPCRPTLLVSGQ
ncbi:hypothetical protein FHG87_006437 [Trinorchestia longiramus]|nr:hypothetical protein FHG87_006437 [Trinorchestia longiramus]